MTKKKVFLRDEKRILLRPFTENFVLLLKLKVKFWKTIIFVFVIEQLLDLLLKKEIFLL